MSILDNKMLLSEDVIVDNTCKSVKVDSKCMLLDGVHNVNARSVIFCQTHESLQNVKLSKKVKIFKEHELVSQCPLCNRGLIDARERELIERDLCFGDKRISQSFYYFSTLGYGYFTVYEVFIRIDNEKVYSVHSKIQGQNKIKLSSYEVALVNAEFTGIERAFFCQWLKKISKIDSGKLYRLLGLSEVYLPIEEKIYHYKIQKKSLLPCKVNININHERLKAQGIEFECFIRSKILPCKSTKREFYGLLEKSKDNTLELFILVLFSTIFTDVNHLLTLLKNYEVTKKIYESYFKYQSYESDSTQLSMYDANSIKLFFCLKERFGEKWLIKKVLGDDFFGNKSTYEDLLSMYDDCCVPDIIMDKNFKIRGLKCIHDKIVRIENDTDLKLSYYEYRYSDEFLSLNGEHKGYRFSLVRSNVELYEWAKVHENCLFTRHESTVKNFSAIVGMYKQDKHLYSIEVSKDVNILEIAGKYNSPPNNLELEIAKEFIASKKRIWWQCHAPL